MASALAFAHILLVHCPGERDELLSLLCEVRRCQIEEALNTMPELSPEEAELQLKLSREEQLHQQGKEPTVGMQKELISPKLSAWLTRPF
jgi:hypothetical protein